MQIGSPLASVLGGALIGLASALVLLLHGRIAGISGIMRGGLQALLARVTGDCPTDQNDVRVFQWSFLLGLVGTGAAANMLLATLASQADAASSVVAALPITIISGLLVGFGTSLGSGCTSGHGVCGIGRGSVRSMVAVAIFMGVAMITVFAAGLLHAIFTWPSAMEGWRT